LDDLSQVFKNREEKAWLESKLYQEYYVWQHVPLDSIPMTTVVFMRRQVLDILGMEAGKHWLTMPSFGAVSLRP
jgi:hypothetical protein